ncbi:phosphoribosyltransferase family protein [Mycolicibacterium setense]|uniref:phosphoribosyltransferase family protein n=1 Tax=Mycolicibacterium setense TaxID=431269 RepID=UPI000690591B|nr:phosphoribosyltransferase family protein [Mycolicibacterium setense]MCV7111694.1 ribose-phosphate pyrophosphokinase [Mycolicibacterium setense]
MSLSFHTFDPVTPQLRAAPGAVEAYPGGDVAVRHLEPVSGGRPVAWNTGGALDFAALAQWAAFHEGARPVLVMPYLPSARGDHDATYDAQGVARLTGATGIRDVIAADPHSGAWAAAAAAHGTTVHSVSATELIATSTLAEIAWDGVIAPDKGAVDRAGAVADKLGVPLLTAGKVRDPKSGALSGFAAPDGLTEGRYLLVDDICDGGGTFAGLAQAIRETEPAAELHLWVTHGLFTGRWRENLLPHFASITAANTSPDVDPDALPAEVQQVPLIGHVVSLLTEMEN